MLAFVGPDGAIIAIYGSEAEAIQQRDSLGLTGLIVPIAEGADPLKLKVRVTYKLEKFNGEPLPENLIETIEGEG